MLQDQLVAVARGIEDLRKTLLGFETEIAKHHQNVQSIDLKIPALQAEKQLAGALAPRLWLIWQSERMLSVRSELARLQESRQRVQGADDADTIQTGARSHSCRQCSAQLC